MSWFNSDIRFSISVFVCVVAPIVYGASFDTGLSPEAARDLLATAESPAVPAGSWLRLRDMERSAVRDDSGAEVPPWAAVKPAASVADRRAALTALRARSYHLVALVCWPADSWKNGVRPDQPLRRLPIDLREAHGRSRRLAATYGDLIDCWEIENEPDISFVEENPETYAAFQKACYLGIKAGKPDGQELRAKSEEPNQSNHLSQVSSDLQVSGFRAAAEAARVVPGSQQGATGRSQPSAAVRTSRVLAAAFALPPGPYFNSWVANDGLRYTDGFNYHYYGYAEDFTGVYQQFEEAVTNATSPTSEGEAVLQTNFYPSGNGWQARTISSFAASEGPATNNRNLLQSRPLAVGEPALKEQGRWLVSTGVSVRETTEGWAFMVTGPADGPLRPAMAELLLPDGWSMPAGASLAFEYRVADATLAKREEGSGKSPDSAPSAISRPSPTIQYPEPSGFRSQVSGFGSLTPRELPVFLTEYGYGLMDKEARHTPVGREAQRAWFAAIQPQIKALKIEGPMAFILRPYLEANLNEFGLLMASTDGVSPPSAASSPSSVGAHAVSPALADLLAADASPASRPWMVMTPSASFVVMDVVGGFGLQMSKAHRGYVLQGDSGEAKLIVYNFGAEPISGEVTLNGAVWTFTDGNCALRLTLTPSERREISLMIKPERAERFGAQIATARFRVTEPQVSGFRSQVSQPSPPPSEASPPSSVVRPPVAAPLTPSREFEVLLRAQNGNLYQTWPRLQARESWRWYAQTFTDFTPAFFGRAHVPAALAENKPAALVFFFRPDKYPATYLIHHAQVVEYTRAEAASGKR